jgi:hypothetical protein
MTTDAQWFLFIDADMVFPWDALDRLIAHDKDVVGVAYRKRKPPYEKIGVPCGEKTPPLNGLAEYEMLGLGLVLVKRKVLEKIGAPWFLRVWQKDSPDPANPDGFTTEDTWFCAHARHHGFRIWCDMDLTKEVSHWGVQGVPWEMNVPSA